MFLTVTPNPCIEKTVTLPKLTPGAVHRIAPGEVTVSAGGKGLNAARVATRCGCRTVALSWVGRRQREWMDGLLDAEGVEHEFVLTGCNTRSTYNLLGHGTKTEIIEEGEPLTLADGTAMLEAFARWLPQAKLVAICGSYPPAREPIFHRHAGLLCGMARRAGVPVIYDGKGPAFELAVRSATPPWMIKPNLEEAETLLRREIRTPAGELAAVRDLLRTGARVVVLSCGERGAYLGHPGGIEWLASPAVPEISGVGSGDALVGAFAARFLESGDLLGAIRYGVAAGAANAAERLPAFVGPEEIDPLLPLVRQSTLQLALGQ